MPSAADSLSSVRTTHPRTPCRRIATGAAVVGAGAAAVLLFVRGAAQRQRRHALPSIPEEEPLLNGWLSKLKGARQASSGSS